MKTYTYDKPDNLAELFEGTAARFPDRPVFGTKDAAGEYQWVTYSEVASRVDNLRGGLGQLGIGEGDYVGLIGPNCTDWAVAAFATYGVGARYVPMYEAELPSMWRYVVEDATIKVLFVSKPEIVEQIKNFTDEIPTLEKIILIPGSGEGTMAAVEELGAKNPLTAHHPSHEDIACLIYTSGTTGEPKGVLLSHGNLTSNAQAGWHAYPELDESCRCLSILPWAHSYAQTAELNNFLQFGGSIGFAESVATIADDLQKVHPTHLIAVPRVFNKIYAGLWAKMDETGGLARKLFVMGVEAAKKRRGLAAEGKSSFGVNFKYNLANKVVFKKIREKFGGQLVASLTASATMNVEIANFFNDIGIPVYDCYGLTETSPALTINCPAACKFGTVGKPIEKAEVVIDTSVGDPEIGEGEVIAYGPNVMQGYHKKPEATAAVMTEDGGFRTGDLGRVDEEGYLTITGRIKEQYKLENGKYVFPASIEEEIKLLRNVANAMIYGDGRPFNVCLVVPDFEVLAAHAKANGLSEEPAQLIEQESVRKMIEEEISGFLKGKYGGYEIPRKFIFLAEDFTTENGMLTQTMKLKRRVVLNRFERQIAALY